MVGDALSHASLAGVACGLAFGFDPILGAGVACVAAALGVEAVRRRLPQRAELSIAIILSAGVGLAGVLSGFSKSAAGFTAFLFGSIVAVTPREFAAVAAVSLAATAACALLRKELFLLAMDERAARLAGVNTGAINLIFTVAAAAVVAVAARTAGALVVSSLMAVPTACALLAAKSYRQTMLMAVGFSALSTFAGLAASYYANLRPRSAIVLAGVACFLLTLAIKRIRRFCGC
jgi:zinc transport system permease protein